MSKRYLTTTLPYVNADPHIGFALEIIQADALARFWRAQGHEVFFNTGTDEHGIKIYNKAKESKIEPQIYADQSAEKFKQLLPSLDISKDINFIRTTDSHHVVVAQEFWKLVEKNGYIYKKLYKIKYCNGCELEKTDSELENGRCPLHSNQEIEIREEENYFFKFSAFQDKLLKLYAGQTDFVVPSSRFNEIKSFLERGIEDFSISRLASKMPWGIPVPNDPEQTMYVWFDALVNYISAIGWPDNKFKDWWPVIQVAGKDNLRQQSAMWQAMLMAADLPPSKQIVIHGFITSGGQKMSKSLGNVINPLDIVKEYSTDALRYYLLRHIHPFEDSDFTLEKFKEVYNAHLANGLGNLVSRVMKLSETYCEPVRGGCDREKVPEIEGAMANYNYNLALDYIWQKIGLTDAYVQSTEPFKTIKTDPEKARSDIRYLVNELYTIAYLLAPFLPVTSAKISAAITQNHLSEPLFVRK